MAQDTNPRLLLHPVFKLGFTFYLVLIPQSEMLGLLLDASENWASGYLSVDSCLLTLICLVSICSYCIATSRL